MGITNGGPFGTMINKTGNLVFRKVKGNNVVTIYVPNPRNPKSPEQTTFRTIMKRAGSELSRGIKELSPTLYKDIKHIKNPFQHVLSKSILNIDSDNIPDVIFPQFDNFRISKNLQSNFSFNPFFNQTKFDLPDLEPGTNSKLPFLVILGYNPQSSEWFILPGATIMADGYQGVCTEAAQIGENSYSICQYDNYLYCGCHFWLEIDEWIESIGFINYINEIQPNFFPSFMKSERGDYRYSPIVLTNENLKELRNYVPGLGYTNKFRKNQTYIPTLLNRISGKNLSFAKPVNFYSNIEDLPLFSSMVHLGESININNFTPIYGGENQLEIIELSVEQVTDRLKTNNVTFNFHKLMPTALHTYSVVTESFIAADLPSKISFGNQLFPTPISLIMSYTNNDNGITYFDFCKHWVDNTDVSLLSQLEYCYNVIPQRFMTPSGNCGLHVLLKFQNGEVISRAAQYNIVLTNSDSSLSLSGTTDDFGNLLIELTNDDMDIVGLGFEKATLTNCKIELEGNTDNFPIKCYISGNNYSFVGELITTLAPV
jgi:hypothetical protein